jgi:U3 small nucleolar RNA-associated protein 18
MTESNGVINIVDTQNMMKLGNFKTNSGGCVSMKWSNNSNYLYSLTVNGTVYKWDLRTYRCVQMFNDEGGYKSSHLGLSEEDQYMSIGSQSGFVNLYNVNSLQGQKPLAKPIKSFDNLTSTVTSIAYNHDSQLMCMASSTSKNQVRLVHLPSRKVYSNWPNPNEGGVVYKPTSIEFSPNSAYLTIGNNMGKVNLFRLNYYKAV